MFVFYEIVLDHKKATMWFELKCVTVFVCVPTEQYFSKYLIQNLLNYIKNLKLELYWDASDFVLQLERRLTRPKTIFILFIYKINDCNEQQITRAVFLSGHAWLKPRIFVIKCVSDQTFPVLELHNKYFFPVCKTWKNWPS